MTQQTRCSFRPENWEALPIPAPISAAMKRIFAQRGFPQTARQWFALMLGEDADLILGRHGKRLYNLAGYSHENSIAQFNRDLADLAAIAVTYFVANSPPPRIMRRTMDNYRFDPVREPDGRWRFDIFERETGNLLHITQPRRTLDVARLDCRKWLRGEVRADDEAAGGA